MKKSKLILCICGAGINTSMNAKLTIQDELEALGHYDIEVKHINLGNFDVYKNRKNMVVVWMTQADYTIDAPSFQGLDYLIGSRKKKKKLTAEIVEALLNLED